MKKPESLDLDADPLIRETFKLFDCKVGRLDRLPGEPTAPEEWCHAAELYVTADCEVWPVVAEDAPLLQEEVLVGIVPFRRLSTWTYTWLYRNRRNMPTFNDLYEWVKERHGDRAADWPKRNWKRAFPDDFRPFTLTATKGDRFGRS